MTSTSPRNTVVSHVLSPAYPPATDLVRPTQGKISVAPSGQISTLLARVLMVVITLSREPAPEWAMYFAALRTPSRYIGIIPPEYPDNMSSVGQPLSAAHGIVGIGKKNVESKIVRHSSILNSDGWLYC